MTLLVSTHGSPSRIAGLNETIPCMAWGISRALENTAPLKCLGNAGYVMGMFELSPQVSSILSCLMQSIQETWIWTVIQS